MGQRCPRKRNLHRPSPPRLPWACRFMTKVGRPVDATYIAKKLAASFVTAWNRHDMEGLSELFDENAAFVNVRGGYMLGRGEILRQHAVIHAGPYRKSVLRGE